MPSPIEMLKTARGHLQELGNCVSDIVNTCPDAFSGDEVKEQLRCFQDAYEEAIARLETPKLSIATIGTTSSGKSTLVNALIGRRIAPIERGEMSGGVLRLRHGDTRELHIAETDGAVWDTGAWNDLEDGEIYDRIRDRVMRLYNSERREKDLQAPDVAVTLSILPVADPSLLRLPEGIEFELIDLPGLKSVQDRGNLKVIQAYVSQAFSVVTLDYQQVDEQHRKQLLDELKRVVEYLNGRTDSMVFVLNRVDVRGSDDLPLDECIQQLRHEIQQVLGLETLPDVLPLSARLLYYAQCAWGVGALSGTSEVSSDVRSQNLTAMFDECGSLIRAKTRGDRQIKAWMRDIEDRVEEGEHIHDDDMRQLLGDALEWSGGQALWQCLQKKVQESFAELVILPALMGTFTAFNALITSVDILVETRKLSTMEEVNAEQTRIREGRDRLEREVGRIHKKFRDAVDDLGKLLEEREQNKLDSTKIKTWAQEKGLIGFQDVISAVSDIEKEVTTSIIKPVRDALRNNDSAYDLEEKLGAVVSPVRARSIAKSYDLFGRQIQDFNSSSGRLTNRVRADDAEGKRSLEHAERAVRCLYQSMRNAIEARTSFQLQVKAQEISTAVQSLLEKEFEDLQEACSEHLPTLNLTDAISSEYFSQASSNLPQLPAEFIDLSVLKMEKQQAQERVKTGEHQVQYTTGSCFKTERTRTVDITENQQFEELLLPDKNEMARQWSKGLEQGNSQLVAALCGWILDCLDASKDDFDCSIENILRLVEDSLNQQLAILEQRSQEELTRWEQIETVKNLAVQAKEELVHTSRCKTTHE
ncbi:MAG: dynamin family protein [Elainellaceae cyanobacterium]